MFKIGDRVKHALFGEGTVVIEGDLIGVVFDKENLELHTLDNRYVDRGWFFEPNGYSIKGSISKIIEPIYAQLETQKKQLMNIMCDSGYDRIQISLLLAKVNDDTKNIAQQLESLIGEYKLSNTNNLWWEDFVRDVVGFFSDILFLKSRYKYEFSIQRIDLINKNWKTESQSSYMESLKSDLSTMNFKTGTLQINKRNEKVLKYLKKKLLELVEISDANYEKLSFCNMYNMNNQNKQLYMIISKDIMDTVGMSNFAPIKNENDRLWTSCQRFQKYCSNNNNQILSNLLDVDSVICYITDKSKVEMSNVSGINRYQMLQRNVIRLVKDGDEHAIIIDRSYPNARYTMHMADVIQKKCEENDLQLVVPINYEYAQGSFIDRHSLSNLVEDKSDKKAIKLYYATTDRVDYLYNYPYTDNLYDIEDADNEYDDEDEIVSQHGGICVYKAYNNIKSASQYIYSVKEEG